MEHEKELKEYKEQKEQKEEKDKHVDINSLCSISILKSPSSTFGSDENKIIHCQNLDKNCSETAVSYCSNCDLCFCKKCEASTHVLKIMKTHKIGPIQDRIPKCQTHPQYSLDKVCLMEKGAVLICSECSCNGNGKHYQNIHSLQEIASVIRNNLTKKFEMKKSFDVVLDDYARDTLQHLKDVKSNGDQLILEVDSIFDSLVAKLAIRQKELKDEIRSEVKTQVHDCLRLKEKVSNTKSHLTLLSDNFNKQFHQSNVNSNDYELITSSSNINKKFDDIRQGILIKMNI
mmetsp:Transcript_38684/g.50049  ORF Transcript_38684/g.50049 Transcript_38684/m.50049 type:complete len:288 (+) Transcript_38684:238-1101(+)